MLRQTIIILMFCALVFCHPANAACKGSLSVVSNASDVVEEYRNNVRVYLPIEVLVSNKLLKCADEIWVEAVDTNALTFFGPSLNKNGKLLDVQLKKIRAKNGIRKIDLVDRTTQLWIKLTHFSLFPAGDYDGKLKFSIVSDNEIIEEQFLDMTYYSAPKISISLDKDSQSKVSGSNGDYQIDLGDLANNSQFYWGIEILSNSAYDIVLDSEYNGLRHETNTNAVIDYTISFDNVRILSSEQLTRRYDFAASVKNTWFGFEFELGNVELMPAGNYQDNLSLTIFPY